MNKRISFKKEVTEREVIWELSRQFRLEERNERNESRKIYHLHSVDGKGKSKVWDFIEFSHFTAGEKGKIGRKMLSIGGQDYLNSTNAQLTLVKI